MSILNDLFEQILHSEEKVRARFSRLREVNNEIQESQLRIRDAKDERKSLQGSLVLKNQRLSEGEMKLKWFSIRGTVLTEKEQEMTRKKASLQTEVDNVQEDSLLRRMEFTAEVSRFTSMYDFSGKGREIRVANATENLEDLKQEETVLQQELCGLKQHQCDLDCLRKQRDELISCEAQLEMRLKGFRDQLQSEKNKTRSGEREKETVLNKVHKDPEFQRLSAELEAAKDDTMEGICEALSQELKELQQTYLQKKLQKQKQQQQRQQSRASQPKTHQGQSKRMQAQTRGRVWRAQLNTEPSSFTVADSSDEDNGELGNYLISCSDES